MRSSTDTTTKTMLVLALLAALAVLLRLGENLLPLPVQLVTGCHRSRKTI